MSFLDKLKGQKLLSLTLLVFTLSVGIVIGTVMNTGVFAAKAQSTAPDATPLVIPPATPSTNEFAKLIRTIEPSVVNISTDYTAKPATMSKKNRNAPPQQDEESDNTDGMDMLRRFFKGMPDTPQHSFKSGGTGSGFVVDKNGYIITNNHVVEKADHIKVRFPQDQTEYRAKLIGTDAETDVAVIKIDAGRPLAAVRVGNSEGVQVGDTAVAIGSPFGLEASVTSGIISATGRDITNGAFQRFIQTDAAINPGNSGGPLLNGSGEVIGMNTMIATQSGGYQGIGFALPINTAVNVYNQIIREGKVARGSIGVQYYRNTDQPLLLKALGLKEGVIVEKVLPGTPSDKAGIKSGDAIVAFNGKPVKDGDDLVNRVSGTAIGAQATVTVDREGKRLDLQLTIADREKQLAANQDPRYPHPDEEGAATPEEGKSQAKLGVSIRPMTEREAENPTLTEKGGVVVQSVQENSFADEIGVQDKDIIISINRHPIRSVEDVRKVSATLKPGDPVAFRVLRPVGMGRDGQPQYVGQWLSGALTSNQ